MIHHKIDRESDAQAASADAADGTAEASAEMPEETVGEAAAELASLREDLARHKDAMLRMQAEMDNQRKRLQREVEKSRKFALERVMKDLLEVSDTMERGLEVGAESATVESLREGQQLTLKMLAKVLADHGLEPVEPQGQPFDPELHEAMAVLPSADVDENTVLEVLQKGFLLHDRLLRPARVVVSRKP